MSELSTKGKVLLGLGLWLGLSIAAVSFGSGFTVKSRDFSLCASAVLARR